MKKKLDVFNGSFARLTLILFLHYLVKLRSRSLAIGLLYKSCSTSVVLVVIQDSF